LQSVTVPPEHVASIDLREALLSLAPDLVELNGSFGSVVYRYSGMSDGNIFGFRECVYPRQGRKRLRLRHLPE
jgi:hypothetical protein